MYAFVYELHLMIAPLKPIIQNLSILSSILGIMLYCMLEFYKGK